MTRYAEVFDEHFREWVAAVCNAWEYDRPDDSFYRDVQERLTDQVIEWIGYAVDGGAITEHGFLFNVAGGDSKKGPYRWFSRRSTATVPQCNWEYYVQVAWFARLWKPCSEAAMSITFEDSLMDLAVRRQGELVWCVEVKERELQVEKLLKALVAHGSSVNLDAPDRGNDPLRKAKYLVKHRPAFFSAVAIGHERHFVVSYSGDQSFQLIEAAPPVASPLEPSG